MTGALHADVDDLVAFRIPAPGEWRRSGRCRNAPVDLFFPGQGDDTRQAKSLCANCPVLAECRDYAIPHRDLRGIWGGLSEKERRKLRSELLRSTPVCEPTPIPSATQARGGSLHAVLEQLAEHPGRWARVATYQARGSAHTTASLLRSGRRDVPAGRWEFQGRRLDGGGSALWARLLPEPVEEAS